jgi:RNase H-fold protein (predicted Holliday junction resolvase)
VFLQDERLTSLAAESHLKSRGVAVNEIKSLVDSEAAAIILRDFVAERDRGTTVSRKNDPPSDAT